MTLTLQVLMTFSDFEAMEKVCCVLLEKLDKSVSVGMPQYYHSAECLSNIRYAWIYYVCFKIFP